MRVQKPLHHFLRTIEAARASTRVLRGKRRLRSATPSSENAMVPICRSRPVSETRLHHSRCRFLPKATALSRGLFRHASSASQPQPARLRLALRGRFRFNSRLTRTHAMKLLHRQLAVTALLLATAISYAGKSPGRDGSSPERAILLKQRGTEAIDEEMQWMMKRYDCTPVSATRDAFADAVRQLKAGRKGPIHPPTPWEHGTVAQAGHWISVWMVRTPQGKRHIYFDTGISTSKRGEVPRMESSRADYMTRMVKSLKIPDL